MIEADATLAISWYFLLYPGVHRLCLGVRCLRTNWLGVGGCDCEYCENSDSDLEKRKLYSNAHCSLEVGLLLVQIPYGSLK